MGDVEGRVFAVSPQDGSLIWMKELKAKIIANPRFKENVVFIATMGGRLHSFRVHDGSDYWQVSRVKVTGIEGTIQLEEDAEEMASDRKEEMASDRNFFITLKYKYNFDADDYFGADEKSTIEIVLLDENKLPIMFKEEEEETDSIVIEEIDAGEHIVPGSQSQEKEIQLAGSPGKEKDCPLTVVLKDSKGRIIDTLETEVSFILAEEKKE
jgi:hypothetical protein